MYNTRMPKWFLQISRFLPSLTPISYPLPQANTAQKIARLAFLTLISGQQTFTTRTHWEHSKVTLYGKQAGLCWRQQWRCTGKQSLDRSTMWLNLDPKRSWRWVQPCGSLSQTDSTSNPLPRAGTTLLFNEHRLHRLESILLPHKMFQNIVLLAGSW